ncbi:Scr1 family TA system antitoxin-like transcriptional regulator [Streptomyces sp. NPDC015350]|uniref:Scr1 family TA system antitoxin-like transcriptional regulator n=1 Tax=Streptomyces sp. NPDC015350 TaxID=3364955 RepID=UPI003703000C
MTVTRGDADAGVRARSGPGSGAESGKRSEDESGSGVMIAFGQQLKLLRLRAGLDRTEFGKRVGYAAQSVASFEQGRRIPQPEFIDKSDAVLDAGGLLIALEEVARAQYPPFFRGAAGLEKKATGLCVYGLYTVPGLLQTADYARAGFELERPLPDEEDIERGVSARLARQEIGECVEVAWRKSSCSGAEGGDCVEVAAAATHVHIRDSKQVSGPMLTVGPGAWAGFIGLVAG